MGRRTKPAKGAAHSRASSARQAAYGARPEGVSVDSYRPESDRDPEETQEWVESLESVIQHEGPGRARYLLGRVVEASRRFGVEPVLPLVTDYVNSIPV